MYVITGATGNTGKSISHALLDAGKQVRVIGRSAERMQEFADKGADVFVGEVTDAAAMEQAFADASAVYFMIPPNFGSNDPLGDYRTITNVMADAVSKSPATHIVSLSSVGADQSSGNGPVAGLYIMEQRLNQLTDKNILHLRPGYFMENTFGQVGVIKAMGIGGGPVEPDVRFGMIATQDISEYAAKRLLALDFTGSSHQELQGERDVTYSEVVKVLATKIGKPEVAYQQFTPDQAIEGMMQFGASKAVAESLIELSDGLKKGILQFRDERSAANTTPTSIEQFSETWAAIYNA
jgi:uncharacterized protein YbjT (DUF2867 family)